MQLHKEIRKIAINEFVNGSQFCKKELERKENVRMSVKNKFLLPKIYPRISPTLLPLF